uniref:Protein lifeguard 2 n=1 Tax=Neolamprologus brichardi TaxID=32507 RepID=A0A3Q4N2Z7_NEOBR
MIAYQQVSNDNEPPSYQEATAGEAMLQCDVIKFSFETPPPCLFFSGYAEMEAQFAWDDKTIRRTFIRKVYAILMVQLFVTVGVVGLFTFWQFPWNIILLVLFVTERENVYVCASSSFYNTKSVVLCLGITALVCLSVTIFSFQSKIDVTSCQGVLFSLCMVMLICAIAISFPAKFSNDYLVLTCSACFLHLCLSLPQFLAFDTQMLLGNKRYAISPEEYIFATLSLYLDIIYLFSFLLQLTGEGRE